MSQRTNKKFIVNASSMVTRLTKLRNEAIQNSDEKFEDGEAPFGWWKPALEFEWTSLRKGNAGTLWGNVMYTASNGSRGKLAIRILDERNCGSIMPKTDEGVAKLMKTVKPNSEKKIAKRDKKATIQFQKWSEAVKTDEAGNVLTDESGNPKLPGDDKLSPYFAAINLLNEAFVTDGTTRVKRGAKLVEFVVTTKKANKAATGPEIFKSFADANEIKGPGEIIISSDQAGEIRKLLGSGADPIMKNCVVASNTKVVSRIQSQVSMKADKNAGCELINPITRVDVNFKQEDGASRCEFFDMNKPYEKDGKTQYEVATVLDDNGNPEPISDNNVHEFIKSRCVINGIINAEGLCFSAMGISLPISSHVLVVKQPVFAKAGQEDVFGEDADGEEPEQTAVKPAAKPVEKPAAVEAAPIEAASEADYDEALAALVN